MASGVMLGVTAGSSVVGTGGISTPVAIALATWASATIVNGYETLSAGLNDSASPEALQVRIVQYAYERATGSEMGATGLTITRGCYLSVDIVCSCYSISYNWTTYFKSRRTFIPKYGSGIQRQTQSGIIIEETTSQMRFIGTKVGMGTQASSMAVDFFSAFSDVYQFFKDASNDDVNNE